MARLFPIKNEGRYDGSLIPWSVAEVAYSAYAKLYGRSQTLERLAERGGFGREEFLILLAEAAKQEDESNG